MHDERLTRNVRKPSHISTWNDAMFGFVSRNKQEEVRKIFQNRMNRSFLRQFRYGKRVEPRGAFCEVVWVIPYDVDEEHPEIESVIAAVTKDISPEGLSLVCDAPLEHKRVVVGLERANEMTYVVCDNCHTTSLGYGYFQIGLHPTEEIRIPKLEEQQMRAMLDSSHTTPTSALESAVTVH